MTEISELTALVRRFRDERDWAQFHSPKNLAASVTIEASEFDVPSYRTRTGRQFYEATIPQLVQELARLTDVLERLVVRLGMAEKPTLAVVQELRPVIVEQNRKSFLLDSLAHVPVPIRAT